MNEHINQEDRDLLDMLHEVVEETTDKSGSLYDWRIRRSQSIKNLKSVLIDLIKAKEQA